MIFSPEKNNEINAIDFSLDGDVYATAGKDLCIRIYDAETNEVNKIHKLPGCFGLKVAPMMLFGCGHVNTVVRSKSL